MPMRRAEQHLAGAGEAERGDGGEQRHQQGRKRTGNLVPQAGRGLVGRASGCSS